MAYLFNGKQADVGELDLLPIDEVLDRANSTGAMPRASSLTWRAEDYVEEDRDWTRRRFIRQCIRRWSERPDAGRSNNRPSPAGVVQTLG